MKRSLQTQVWSKSRYYEIAGKGSLDFTHPAMKKLSEIADGAGKILDMGCGEGTRLSKLVKNSQKGYGVDISPKAIALAKKKYIHIDFRVGDLENLPFKSGMFDLVYSAFVFEHLDSPEKVLKEGMRVLKKGGKMMIVAPNFGAPNRASPPYKGNRFLKLVRGFIEDFIPTSHFNWNRVEPIVTSNKYEIDWDTTIEPYLGSLLRYLKSRGFKVKYFSSYWNQDSPSAGLLQKKFRLLGKIGIYPFNLWGPHLAVLAEK